MSRKLTIITCTLLAVAAVVAIRARAQDEDPIVIKTNGPIEFPRFVVGPGTYSLRFVDGPGGDQAVEVTGHDGTNYGAFPVRQVRRLQSNDYLEINLQPESGAPERLKDWFFAGSTTGFEPIYPSPHSGSIASPPSPSGAGN